MPLIMSFGVDSITMTAENQHQHPSGSRRKRTGEAAWTMNTALIRSFIAQPGSLRNRNVTRRGLH